jgi:protein-tyrosine phosphatase
VEGVFVDVHSHVIPSGDDGVASVAEGLGLIREAARRGTAILFGTPHVWPHEELTPERERAVRAAHAEMAPVARAFGLELQLGFELTPARTLLEQDPRRYRLGAGNAVLMELPFSGPLILAERLAEHVEAAGLLPVIAHPERAEEVLERPLAAQAFRDRGWLLQVNATSLLGYHGRRCEETGWFLLERGLVDLVASDGHRIARPPFLDDAYAAVRARVGEETARPLFDGSALGLALVARDRVDLAERG